MKTENAHQYTSNVILKYVAGLSKEITVFAEVDQEVNPILKELSGYMVDYYQEYVNIPSISIRLDDIIKDRANIETIYKSINDSHH